MTGIMTHRGGTRTTIRLYLVGLAGTIIIGGIAAMAYAGLPRAGAPSQPTDPGAPSQRTGPKPTGPPGASLPQIQFELDSHRLAGGETLNILNSLARALNEGLAHQDLFEIQGHSDAGEPLGFSIELSLLRAGTVMIWLVEHGVARDRLYPSGFGALSPANRSQPLSAENRRVVIVNRSTGVSR